jgi:hypothetical protein
MLLINAAVMRQSKVVVESWISVEIQAVSLFVVSVKSIDGGSYQDMGYNFN